MDHWPHGADYVCTILHDYFSSLRQTTPPNEWPHTLFLQVDNCWKENKNTTDLRYMGLLIKFGWFKNVHINSLPVGHTHEDIDQMFSTWNVHYWMTGLQSPIAVPSFLEWAYADSQYRPSFKMLHYCFNFKQWLKEYGVSLTGHSSFRSFKMHLDQLQHSSNVALSYKECSLQQDWIGLNGINSPGIILFHSFPDITHIPTLIEPQELNHELLETLLGTTSITNHLDDDNMEWYLQLLGNSIFYLTNVAPSHLLIIGPHYLVPAQPPTFPAHVNHFISADTVQQHLLRYGIVESDINSIIIADLPFANFPFSIGRTFKVEELIFSCHPFSQRGQLNFGDPWIEIPSLVLSISKDKVIAKRIDFTQKNILKRKWQTLLKLHFNL